MNPDQAKPDGGLSALMDFGFTKFVTLGVVKVLYLLGMGLIALAFLGALITSFTQGFVMVIAVLIVGPLVALIYLLFFRIWLELIVVMFRIAENTNKLVELQGGKTSGGTS